MSQTESALCFPLMVPPKNAEIARWIKKSEEACVQYLEDKRKAQSDIEK